MTAVDMSKFVVRWLTNAALAAMDDLFDGVIADVAESQVRNKFTGVRTTEPVVTFVGGWRWIPSLSARQALVTWFGTETDAWRGRRVQVVRQRIERVDKNGATKVRYERVVSCADVHARAAVNTPKIAVDELSDYDDSDEALSASRTRR